MARSPDNQTFEITLKLTRNDPQRVETICCHEILTDDTTPGIGEQVGEIVAQALVKLFPEPCRYDVANLRACVDAISGVVYETHDELFAQFNEKE